MLLRATKINIYARLMQAQGISAKKLLTDTGIDAKRVASPDYLVSLEQYHTVVLRMIKLTGNPGVGFLLADVVKPADLGIVGYALMSCNTLRQALRVWMKYSNSLVGTSVRIDLIDDTPPGYVLSFTPRTTVDIIGRFETEELLTGIRMIPVLTGVSPVLRHVSFSYPEPHHSRAYKTFFKCPIAFDAKKTMVSVEQPNLDAPIQTRNDELHEVCAQHCRRVMRSLPGAALVRSQLRNLFLRTPGNLPRLDEAASGLGISERGLRRKLDDIGQSYQALKDEFRFDLVREYLQTGHLAPKEVAHLLGFASPSVLSRAFKTWTGQTIRSYFERDED